jgi:hypothetical protein
MGPRETVNSEEILILISPLYSRKNHQAKQAIQLTHHVLTRAPEEKLTLLNMFKLSSNQFKIISPLLDL